MDLGLLQEFEFLGRLFLAGLAEPLSAMKRANRRKEAGIRTIWWFPWVRHCSDRLQVRLLRT